MKFTPTQSRSSSKELHSKALILAANEKQATLALLECLAEVDRTRLFAEMAYSSLWEYVHKGLRYSEAQTSDRVSAMKIMVQIPEVHEYLVSGELTLTSAAKFASHIRREKLQTDETVALLHTIAGKSSRVVDTPGHARGSYRYNFIRS